jgi:nucleoside-diphosphate-sugar epimerase
LRAIVTGASGFVGRALVARCPSAESISLGREGWPERIAATAWRDATVFHLAARVHEPHGDEGAFDHDNVEKTIQLAEAAASSGARRFVFLSSIKVNGDETRARPFVPADTPAPANAYARSKWKAELALHDISRRFGIPLVVIRAPLVVGAGAGGNLRALMRVASSRWPLPFGAVRNRRTLVDVRDLASLLLAAGDIPLEAPRLYFAGDPDPVSTPQIIGAIRAAWSRPAGLLRINKAVLESLAAIGGRGAQMRRLTRSLELDVSDTLRDLAWRPSTSIEASLARMAVAYREGMKTP